MPNVGAAGGLLRTATTSSSTGRSRQAACAEPRRVAEEARIVLSEEDFDLFRQFRIKAMGDTPRNMVDDSAFDDLTFEEKSR